MDALRYLNRTRLPYRIRLHVLPEYNQEEPEVFAHFCRSMGFAKSVILDFSRSTLNKEEQRRYRDVFLEYGVILY